MKKFLGYAFILMALITFTGCEPGNKTCNKPCNKPCKSICADVQSISVTPTPLKAVAVQDSEVFTATNPNNGKLVWLLDGKPAGEGPEFVYEAGQQSIGTAAAQKKPCSCKAKLPFSIHALRVIESGTQTKGCLFKRTRSWLIVDMSGGNGTTPTTDDTTDVVTDDATDDTTDVVTDDTTDVVTDDTTDVVTDDTTDVVTDDTTDVVTDDTTDVVTDDTTDVVTDDTTEPDDTGLQLGDLVGSYGLTSFDIMVVVQGLNQPMNLTSDKNPQVRDGLIPATRMTINDGGNMTINVPNIDPVSLSIQSVADDSLQVIYGGETYNIDISFNGTTLRLNIPQGVMKMAQNGTEVETYGTFTFSKN